MEHCQKPCPYNWSGNVDGEHDWGYYDPETMREHCNHCNADAGEICSGREYVNPIIKLSDATIEDADSRDWEE